MLTIALGVIAILFAIAGGFALGLLHATRKAIPAVTTDFEDFMGTLADKLTAMAADLASVPTRQAAAVAAAVSVALSAQAVQNQADTAKAVSDALAEASAAADAVGVSVAAIDSVLPVATPEPAPAEPPVAEPVAQPAMLADASI